MGVIKSIIHLLKEAFRKYKQPTFRTRPGKWPNRRTNFAGKFACVFAPRILADTHDTIPAGIPPESGPCAQHVG